MQAAALRVNTRHVKLLGIPLPLQPLRQASIEAVWAAPVRVLPPASIVGAAVADQG